MEWRKYYAGIFPVARVHIFQRADGNHWKLVSVTKQSDGWRDRIRAGHLMGWWWAHRGWEEAEQETEGACFDCWGSCGALSNQDPAVSYNHMQYWFPHCTETNAHHDWKAQLAFLTALGPQWLGQAWKEVGGVCGSCRVRVRAPQGGATNVTCWYQPLTGSGCGRRLLSWLCAGCQCCQNCRSASFWSLLWVATDENFSQFSGYFYTSKRGKEFLWQF